MFLAPMLTAPDSREDYGEDRVLGIGFLRDLVVVIVFMSVIQTSFVSFP